MVPAQVLVDKQSVCPECLGTGANQPDDLETCSQCKGSGQMVTRQQIAPGFVQQMQQQYVRGRGC